tara:strand:- start:93 stop:1547 length:1455 start_codon:yes stop_codon:yes gene_type:complete
LLNFFEDKSIGFRKIDIFSLLSLSIFGFFRNEYSCILVIPFIFIFFYIQNNKNLFLSRLDTFIIILIPNLLVEYGIAEEFGGGSTNILIKNIFLIFLIISVWINTLPRKKDVYLSFLLLIPIFLISFLLRGVNNIFSFSEALTMGTYIFISIIIGQRELKNFHYIEIINFINSLFWISIAYSLNHIINKQIFEPGLALSYDYNFSNIKFFFLIAPLIAFKRQFNLILPLSLLISGMAIISGSSRTLIISYILIIAIYSITELKKFINYFFKMLILNLKNNKIYITKNSVFKTSFFVIFFISLLIIIFYPYTSRISKPLGFLTIAGEFFTSYDGSFYDFIKLLDPIRFYEWEYWLNNNSLRIIFGNGLGSGIDITPLFSEYSIKRIMGGYSLNITNNQIFNLHDVFTWYGISIGIYGILIVSLPIWINSFKSTIPKFGFYLLYLSAWYSLGGNIIFFSIIAMSSYNFHKLKQNQIRSYLPNNDIK